VNITLQDFYMHTGEFFHLVELLKSEDISPSIRGIELEPANIDDMSAEDSLFWASAFVELQELIKMVSPEFEMSDMICVCRG
jgi:hypothetical protein